MKLQIQPIGNSYSEQAFGIDFEVKWFSVIFTIYKKEMASVVEIANEIGYTHPSTIILLKNLKNWT